MRRKSRNHPKASSQTKLSNTGKQFEEAAEAYFRNKYPEAHVHRNVIIPGMRGDEQIDILIVLEHHGLTFRIGVEAKDYRRKLDKDRYGSIEAKFQSARLSKGIILCREGVQPGFLKRFETRTMDIEEPLVMTYEQLVEGAWAKDFLDAFPLLMEAKKCCCIDEALAQKTCLAITTHKHYATFFFDHFDNPAWIPHFSKRGVLKSALSEHSVIDIGQLVRLLSDHASLHQEEFLELVNLLEETTPDPGFHFLLVKAAAGLNAAGRNRFIESLIRWKSLPQWGAEPDAKLIELTFSEGEPHVALNWLTLLTSFDTVESESVFGGTLRDLRANLHDDEFGVLTLELLPRLSVISPLVGLPYLRGRLQEAVRTNYPGANGEFPTFVIEHLANSGQFGPRGVLQHFAFAYRDCLIAVAESDPQAATLELLDVMSLDSEVLPLRCAIFAVAHSYKSLSNISRILLQKEEWWHRRSLLPELETFVELSWPMLSEQERERILDLVLSPPILLSDSDAERGELEMERKVRIVQWLAIIKGLDLPQSRQAEVERVYRQYSKETGITSRSDRRGVRIIEVEQTPPETYELHNKSIEDILYHCNEREPYSQIDWMKSEEDGFPRALSEEVFRRPLAFYQARPLLKALRHQKYMRAIISGLRKCAETQGSDQSPLLSLLEMLELVIGASANIEDSQSDSVSDTPPSWTMRDAADLLNSVLTHRAEEADIISTRIVMRVWGVLWEQESRICDTEFHWPNDALMASLNTTEGILCEALCRAYLSMKKRAKGCEWLNGDEAKTQEAIKEVRAMVVATLLPSQRPGVNGSLGRFIPNFYHYDRDLLLDMVSLYANDNVGDRMFNTMEGHFCNPNRYHGLSGILRPTYQHLLQCPEMLRSRSRLCRGLGEELAIYWWHGEFADDDLLLRRLFQVVPNESLVSAVNWLCQNLREGSAEEQWRRVLWFHRNAAVSESADQSDLAIPVANALANVPESICLGEVRSVLVAGLCSRRCWFRTESLDFLRSRVALEPRDVVAVLRDVAQYAPGFAIDETVARFREVLQESFINGDEVVRLEALDIERDLLIRGVTWVAGAVSRFREKA